MHHRMSYLHCNHSITNGCPALQSTAKDGGTTIPETTVAKTQNRLNQFRWEMRHCGHKRNRFLSIFYTLKSLLHDLHLFQHRLFESEQQIDQLEILPHAKK